MNKNVLRALFVFGMATTVCLSGCDQAQKFVGYFFPESKTSDEDTATPYFPDNKETETPAQLQRAGSRQKTKDTSPVLATVGTWTLTADEFEARLESIKTVLADFDTTNPEARKIILDELIRQQLLVMEAEKRGMDQNAEIMQAVEEFKRTLLVREVANAVTQSLQVSEQEARDYYDKNSMLFIEPPQWHVREIVVETEEEAKEILVSLLQKTSDFAEVARNRSQSISAQSGGDLGFLTEMPFDEMAQAIAVLDEGGISSVFSGPYGYYIVKLEETTGGGKKTYDEVSAELKQGLLLMKQQEALLGYIEELKEKNSVTVNEDILEE